VKFKKKLYRLRYLQKKAHFLFWVLFLTTSHFLVNAGTINENILVSSHVSPSLQEEITNYSIIQDDYPEIGMFVNGTGIITHNWKLENINSDQAVFLSITPHSPYTKSDLNVGLFRPSGTGYSQILLETISSADYLASWEAPETGDWIIQVNDTRLIPNGNFSYSIQVSVPDSGFSLASAISVNSSPTLANFTISHDNHYWKVWLNENQIGRVNLKEINQTVLRDSKITIFRQQNPQNPILLPTDILQSNYTYSWNAPESDTYFIVVSHKADKSYPIGYYNISFSAETTRFNFESAEKLPNNQTVTIKVIQGFIPRKRYFFKFKVNESRTLVNIRVFELNSTVSTVLDFALVEVFDEGHQEAIFTLREEDQKRDGQMNISENLDTGLYYLVVTPESNAVGEFYIFLEYRMPQPFVWNFLAIITSIGIILLLPIYLIFLDSKGRWYRVDQWTVSSTLKKTFMFFRNSFKGIYNIKEVPNDSILVRVASIPFHSYTILNFVESSENETLVFSKRISRKYEWGIYFLIGIAIFDVLNIFSYFFFSIHLLPLYFSNLTSLILFLAIPTVILLIIVLFTNVSSYISYSQVYDKITYIIHNYDESKDNDISPLSLDPVQAAKSINYVRVLWNQARHAFKDQKYELFVIKADAAVKNLLSTRYLQICPINSQTKPEFQVQVMELRKRGFDLPNDKKIAHFRNLRNRIVHSSVTLGEKESVDCFSYYSTFISRLGLRPT
jgi:hypothetical protein